MKKVKEALNNTKVTFNRQEGGAKVDIVITLKDFNFLEFLGELKSTPPWKLMQFLMEGKNLRNLLLLMYELEETLEEQGGSAQLVVLVKLMRMKVLHILPLYCLLNTSFETGTVDVVLFEERLGTIPDEEEVYRLHDKFHEEFKDVALILDGKKEDGVEFSLTNIHMN